MAVELLVVDVGLGIGKAVLHAWLKDSSVADGAASGILDFIKTKTIDRRAQTAGNRAFERIGEEVTQSLLPVLESEGAALDEGERYNVARAIAGTLDSIDTALLAEQNLDPKKLANHLIEVNRATLPLLSEAAEALYQRVIDLACQAIVDIAAKMPSFSERSFGEVLRREDDLVAVALLTLEEIKRIQATQATVDVKASQFEGDYRRAVIRTLDRLRLIGIELPTPKREVQLSAAYITLGVVDRGLEDVTSATPTVSAVPGDIVTLDSSPRGVTTTAETLMQARRWVIRSGPGSGKTTFLQWLAVRAASKDFPGALVDWNDCVPFFIPLRQYYQRDQKELPRPENFVDSAASTVAGIMPPGWVHDQLRNTNGRGLVLIDGMDEVPETWRLGTVWPWLSALLNSFPDARFIVASRPYAVDESWRRSLKFRDAEIQPMSLSDIGRFVHLWHRAVQRELEDSELRDLATERARSLAHRIAQDSALRRLARNPLLCAMLCVLHWSEPQIAKTNRTGLYDGCCKVLLEQRETERGISLSDYPQLTYPQKRELLEDFAYWLVRNSIDHSTQVSIGEADKQFGKKLSELGIRTKDVTGSGVRRLFVERSNMLRQSDDSRIEFTHEDFLAFLAAKAAVDAGDIGFLINNAHDSEWLDVIVLSAGHASAKGRAALVRGIIERADQEQDELLRRRLYVLSGLSTGAAIGLQRNVRSTVNERLVGLVPPRNTTEAQGLQVAGASILSHLAADPGRESQIAVACVRTLVLIGSKAALELLPAYAADKRPAVVEELVLGWDYFDRVDYARRVLVTLIPQNYDSRFASLPSFEGFQFFSTLTNLTVDDCDHISDIGPLGDVRNLSEMTLKGCRNITDWKPLASLASLSYLYLEGIAPGADLGPFGQMTSLTTLILVDCPSNVDLNPVRGIRNLSVNQISPAKELKRERRLAWAGSGTG